MSIVTLLLIALIMAIVLAIVFGVIILVLILGKKNANTPKQSVSKPQNTGKTYSNELSKTLVLNEPNAGNKTVVLNEPNNEETSERNETVMLFGSDVFVQKDPETYIKLTPKPGQNPAGYEYKALINNTVTIGRSKVDLVIEGDKSVSGQHCEITKEGSLFMLKDLNSSNGTFYNGYRVTSPVAVESGGCIQIGRTEYVLTIEEE